MFSLTCIDPISFKYGCFVISNSWMNEKNKTLINLFISSLVSTLFLRSVDTFDAIKGGELLFTHLDIVVEKVEEKNVVQNIINNSQSM